MIARWLSLGALLCVLVSFVAGCGNSGSTTASGGTISGTINYTGTAAGGGRPLAIAVYHRTPPSGPPVAYRLVESYEFPYRYSFDNLPPGNYVVGALIDIDPTDTRYTGMLNTKRDPYGYSNGGAVVHVDEQHGAVAMDIKLEGVE